MWNRLCFQIFISVGSEVQQSASAHERCDLVGVELEYFKRSRTQYGSCHCQRSFKEKIHKGFYSRVFTDNDHGGCLRISEEYIRHP